MTRQELEAKGYRFDYSRKHDKWRVRFRGLYIAERCKSEKNAMTVAAHHMVKARLKDSVERPQPFLMIDFETVRLA